MKKILLATLCAAAMISVVTPSWAASTTNTTTAETTSSATTTNAATAVAATTATATTAAATATADVNAGVQYTATAYTVKYNNAAIDLKSDSVVQIGKVVMVPLRPVSEALGFTLHWDDAQKAIHLEDGLMQSDIRVGDNNYFAYSSGALGMTAPEKLGEAPVIINNSTYVPVDFYKILLTYNKAVTVSDKLITIVKNPNDKVVKSPVKNITLEKSSTQMENPLVEYKTLADARKAAGINFAVPTIMPVGYNIKNIALISSKLATVDYVSSDKKIAYRTEKGNANISGDYNVYTTVRSISIGTLKVITKGTKDDVSLAEWSQDGVSYSLSFDEPVQGKTLAAIIDSIA